MIQLRPRAIADIADLSDAYLEGLRAAFCLIERFPNVGSRYARWRKWRCRNHRIYYRIDDRQNLIIVRILHERRRVPRRLG